MNLKKIFAGLLVATCCAPVQAELPTKLGFKVPALAVDTIDEVPSRTSLAPRVRRERHSNADSLRKLRQDCLRRRMLQCRM